jgi:plasmid stabilization system protein ParE
MHETLVFAPSFSCEADDIAAYIDEQFGEKASDEFIANLMAVCTLIANFPGIGKSHV